jgi:hypothetical protein
MRPTGLRPLAQLSWTLFVPLLLVASCGRGREPEGTDSAPALVLLDSVQLKDPDSGPLGNLGSFLPLSNDGYLLVDAQNFRLVEYDAKGNSLRTIGHKGSGPGEFMRMGPIALDGDSILYVVDSRQLNVVDYKTAEFREKARAPLSPFAASIVAGDGAVWFRTVDSLQTPRLSVWSGGSTRDGPTLPAASDLATVKSSGAGENARMVNTTHSDAVFARLDRDTLAVLSQSSENVLVITPERVISEFPVARTQRQGVRADLIAQMAANPDVVQRDPQIVYTPSLPTAVSRNAAGQFITVKTDLTFLTNHFAAKHFLSVTEPKSGRTCPDARIPGPEDPRPSIALRGDTLFVLAQEIEGTAAVTVVRKYIVRTATCKWISAAG